MKGGLPENPNLGIQYNPEQLKTIFLAGGCFWGTEAYIVRIYGVAETRCGYANGHTINPSYEAVCGGETGHAETVRVRYDPGILPLPQLLRAYFRSINPVTKNRQGGDVGSQYRTGIYYVDEADVLLIRQVIDEVQRRYEKPVATEVFPLSCFYDAERYHQRYLEKNPDGYCHVDLGLLRDTQE